MSWEKEEAKSRHVDFQCVRSKSITNLSVDGIESIETNANPISSEGAIGGSDGSVSGGSASSGSLGDAGLPPSPATPGPLVQSSMPSMTSQYDSVNDSNPE